MVTSSRTLTRLLRPDLAARWSRRGVIAGLAAPLLAGCSSDPNSDGTTLARMIGQSIFGSDQQKLRSELASIPYATIGVRVGGGPQTILVLATQRGNTLLWTSKSQIVIETQSGRVSRSTGLPHDLAAISDNGGDPLAAGAKKLVGATPSSRYLDFTDRRGKHNLVHSVLTPQGRDDIEILETSVATVHFVERSFCTTLGWDFVDEFWADYKSGFIWRSVQHIHPDMAAVEIETFRPPAS